VSSFTCTDCGATFSLRKETLDKYPGWTPKQCMACRDGATAGGATRRRRPSSAAVEENLTVAQVLAKYTHGPANGVFTDGSAQPNPGPGGWGAVYVVDGEVVDQRHGHHPDTTNNRMELTALIEGFDLVPPGTPATVYTDSKLCVDTITKWAKGWEANGWKRKTGPIKNLDLVKQLYAKAKARPELQLAWIAAHSGNRWNEYADSLSTAHLRDEL
jgi:ribonuclease HI